MRFAVVMRGGGLGGPSYRGGVGLFGESRKREATGSNGLICPKAKERRNEQKVDGASQLSKSLRVAPCRIRAMSSMESAPAIMPPTSAVTFASACAPLSVGTRRCRSASPARLTCCASRMIGISPADDRRFASSKVAAVIGSV